MAATSKLRSPSATAASGDRDHHRFLRPGALARLRDARLRRASRATRPPPPSSPASPSSPPPPAAGDGEGVAAVPYFAPASRLLAPRCPQRKKLAAAKSVVLFAPPPPSADLPPIEAVLEFISAPDMVVAAH